MRTILIGILLLTSCVMCTDAHISLQMSYYNSDDDMSMSLEGANLAFESFCTIEPHSLTYSNGGSSKQPQAEYSYSLALNGETTFSSAETDSGMFGWSGNVDAGGDLGLDSLKVSTVSAVKDGSLNVAYGNDDLKVQEMVEAEKSGYQQQAQLGPNTVFSKGSGSTLQPVTGLAEILLASTKQSSFDTTETEDDTAEKGETSESSNALKTDSANLESSNDAAESTTSSDAGSNPESDPASSESQSQGIRYTINVQNIPKNKQGTIDSDVMGRTEAQWATQVKSESDEYYSFGVKTRGIGFAPIDELDMIGKATGFPIQILPPGNVKISYKDKTDSETSESWDPWAEPLEKYLKLIDQQSRNFDSAYAGKSTPALWYYIENVYENKIPANIYYNPNLMGLEQYQLSMEFKVSEE